MALIETWLRCELGSAVQVQYLNGNLFSQDNQANLIGVRVYENGEPASLSGSVSANVIRADGGTVAVAGTLQNGNECYVILPQSAYAVPGAVSVIIKITSSGQVTTLAAAVSTVYTSSTATAVDPGTIIPSIQSLISAIETAVASIPADYSSLWTSLAPAFSTSTAYTAGQYTTYDGKLWRFTTDHAAGSWNAAHAVQVNLGGDVSDLKSALGTMNNVLKMNDPTPINWFKEKDVGVKASDGADVASSVFSATNYIDVRAFEKITYKRHIITGSSINTGIAFYDENKTFISNSGVLGIKNGAADGVQDNTVNVPAGACYVRCTIWKDQTKGAFSISGQSKLIDVVDNINGAIGETQNAFADFLLDELGITTYVFKYNGNKAIPTNGETIPLTEAGMEVPSSPGPWKYCIIPCAEGDIFHVKINAGNSSFRPWAFASSNGTKLSVATSNSQDTYLTAPENAAYLVCNVRDNEAVGVPVYKVTKGTNRKQDILDNINPIKWQENKAIATNGDTVGDPADVNGRRCAVVDLTGVECVTLLNATGSSTYRPWCFIDNSGNKISTSSLSVENTRRLYKPTGATKLCINTTMSAETNAYIGSYVDNADLLEIASDVRNYGCMEQYMSNGGWSTSGYLNRQYRTFTKPDLVLDFDATIRCTEDYQIAVIYDDNGIAKDSGWTRVFNVKRGSAFSVVTRKATEDTTSVADVHEFAMNVTVEKTVNPLSMPVFVTDKARIVMHRGYMADTTNIPENSIPAFEKAGQIGAWAIETDVQETSDGYYVLMHDNTVNRTTTGTGSISSMTYEQTQELYLIGGDGTLKIPSLSDFLAICKKWNMVGVIEIKSILRGKTSMKEIIDIVHEYGLDDRVIYLFNSETDMDYYSALDNIAPMSFNVDSSDDYESAIDTALKYPRCGIAYQSGSKMTNTIAKKCHAHNIFLNTWISSAWDAQAAYFARGCDMVTSNSNAIRPTPTT